MSPKRKAAIEMCDTVKKKVSEKGSFSDN